MLEKELKAKNLKFLRELHNYSQEYVAEKILHISQKAYSKYERGETEIPDHAVQLLSVSYQMNVAEILPLTEDELKKRIENKLDNFDFISEMAKQQEINAHLTFIAVKKWGEAINRKFY
jgi:transcriptional regulator with XRE-family HTH domain